MSYSGTIAVLVVIAVFLLSIIGGGTLIILMTKKPKDDEDSSRESASDEDQRRKAVQKFTAFIKDFYEKVVLPKTMKVDLTNPITLSDFYGGYHSSVRLVNDQNDNFVEICLRFDTDGQVVYHARDERSMNKDFESGKEAALFAYIQKRVDTWPAHYHIPKLCHTVQFVVDTGLRI